VRVHRIGGASALFAAGATPESIKALGRWWSDAYLLYIRSSQQSAERLLASACSVPVASLEAQYDDHLEDDEL
jgi:hypothetical protein